MNLLKEQQQGAAYRGLPVEERNVNTSVEIISSETVQFYYSNGGTRTADAGQAAGVAVEAVLIGRNIRNQQGKSQATVLDTSLSFTSTAFTQEVQPNYEQIEMLDNENWAARLAAITAPLSNGQYVVDYAKGVLYGKKASTQTTLIGATYKVENPSMTVVPSGPSASSSFSTAKSDGVLEASRVVKASAGTLYKAIIQVDSTLATGTYYLQFSGRSCRR